MVIKCRSVRAGELALENRHFSNSVLLHCAATSPRTSSQEPCQPSLDAATPRLPPAPSFLPSWIDTTEDRSENTRGSFVTYPVVPDHDAIGQDGMKRQHNQANAFEALP